MKSFFRSLLTALKIVLILVMILSIAGMGWFGYLIYTNMNSDEPVPSPFAFLDNLMPTHATAPAIEIPTVATTVPTVTEPPTEPPTVGIPEHVVSRASIASVGDLLMHKPVFDSCLTAGGYDFTGLFRNVQNIISSADYAVANLETTFGGDGFVYQGNPAFNCPDSLVNAVAEAGFDMLLTANNHSGDTMGSGIQRTLDVVRNAGLATLGSQKDSSEPNYAIVDINGIRIGMVCYTWSFSGDGNQFSLNGLTPVKDIGQMNYFTNANPDKLYREVGAIMEQMKAEGAEATMLFIHWGQEYILKETALQDTIAQKMCDLGFDVIVGGHPHVVEPVSLLQSTTDPNHRTICIYSLGNFISNQRRGNISQISTAHTEDGVIFTVTFEKYSDGTVYLSGVELIPTWVYMETSGARRYDIFPLIDSERDLWVQLFGISEVTRNACASSYDRTMAIVGEGLDACRQWLVDAKVAREDYYYDLFFYPERNGLPASA